METVLVAAVTTLFAALAAAVAWQRWTRSRAVRHHRHMFEGRDRAYVSQWETATAAGSAALLLMIAFNLAALWLFWSDLSGPLAAHHVLLAAAWIAGNQMLTVLVLLAREREFIVRERLDGDAGEP